MAADQVQDAKLIDLFPLSEQEQQAKQGNVASDQGMSVIGILEKRRRELELALDKTRSSLTPPLDLPGFVADMEEARRLSSGIRADRLRQSPLLRHGEDHPVQTQASGEAEQVQAGKLITFGTRGSVAQEKASEFGSRVAGNVSALASLARGELSEMRLSVNMTREALAAYRRTADTSEMRELDQVAQVLNEMDIELRGILEAAQQTGAERQPRAA